MNDTDKYASTNGRYFTKDMVIRYYKLHEEVQRLREVAYRKDMQIGERDKEVKRLRKEYELISNLYMNLEKNYRAFLRGD